MSFFGKQSGVVGSFLPEDYLQKKAERRGIFIALFLFAVVALGVIAAFFVTNRQWQSVKSRQEQINREYATETKKIEQLKALESQKADMLSKAEITTALIEKVPRSIMLAEIINRMPEEMTLTELSLKSKRVVEAQPAAVTNALETARMHTGPNPNARSLAGGPSKSAAEPPPRPAPPRFEFRIELTGLAATDDEVADYHASLTRCPLLDQVEMLSAVEVVVEDVPMRKFRIDATIKPAADARMIEPLHVPRGTQRTAEVKPSAPAAGLLGLFAPGKKLKPRPGHNPLDPTLPRDEEEPDGTVDAQNPTEDHP